MKVSVDREVCVGCGMCVSLCPDVYEMEGALAVVIVDTVPSGQEECAKRAATDCPVAAISVSE